jgi:hypothetical protein
LAQTPNGLPAGAADDEMLLAETETRLQVLTQRCLESTISEADLSDPAVPTVPPADAALVGSNLCLLPLPESMLSGSQDRLVSTEQQEQRLPYQPYRAFPVRLPSRMITDNCTSVFSLKFNHMVSDSLCSFFS